MTVPEKQFQQSVLDTMRLLQWRTFHTFDSRRSQAGFPDICAVRRDRLIFAELKAARGKLAPAQRVWLDALGPVAETYVWRPADWDQVVSVLR